MSKRKKRTNPFYVILVLAGVAFCVTACAYGVMAVKQLHADAEMVTVSESDKGFVQFMDQNGPKMMLIELGVLAVATFAAIGTDDFWSGESSNQRENQTS